MRKFIFAFILAILPFFLNGQERLDSLYFLDGTVDGVTVTVNHEDKIEYVYPGETMINILSKERLRKIVFRSGRVCVCKEETVIVTKKLDPNIARMAEIKAAGEVVGDIRDFENKSVIGVRLVLSDNIAGRLSTPWEEIRPLYTDAFLKTLNLPINYTEDLDKCDITAEVIIVDADVDGEMFGILDYYKPGESAPFYSMYLNGNGNKTGDTFEYKLLGGVTRSAKGIKEHIYKPMPDYIYREYLLQIQERELLSRIKEIQSIQGQQDKQSEEYAATKSELDR